MTNITQHIKKIVGSVSKTIPIIMIGLFLAWVFDTGAIFKWGFWGLLGISIVIAGIRIGQQWDQYKAVVNNGAEQLKLMKQIKEKEKEKKKKKI